VAIPENPDHIEVLRLFPLGATLDHLVTNRYLLII